MGQNCCQSESFPLNLIEWQEVETLRHKKIWKNTISGQQIEEYFIRARDSQDQQRQIDFFNLRADHPFLVSAKYITIKQNNSLCCSEANGSLFLEKINYRLQNLGHLSLPSVLYIYYNAFSGFKQLSSHCGYFIVQKQMICANQSNLIKVWMNSDLSASVPQTIHLRSQQQMIRSIIQCINTKYHQIMPSDIEDFFKNHAVKTFEQAILTLKQYATLHNIVIAVNGLNFSDLEQKVSQQINSHYTLIQQKQIKSPKILRVQNVGGTPMNKEVFIDARPRRHSIIQQKPVYKQLIPPLPPTIKKLPPTQSTRKNQQIIKQQFIRNKFTNKSLKKQLQPVRHKSVMPTRRSIVTSQIPQIQNTLIKTNVSNPRTINNISEVKRQVKINEVPIMWKTSDGHTCEYIWDIIKLGRQEQACQQYLNSHQVNLQQSKHRQLSTIPSNTTRSFSSLNISKRFSQTQLRNRAQSIQKNTLYDNPYANFSRFGNLIEECRHDHQKQEQSSPTQVPGRKHHDAEHTSSRLFHLIRSNFGQKKIQQRSYSSEPYMLNTHQFLRKQDQISVDNNIQPIVHSLNIIPISTSTSIRSSGLQLFSKATGRTSAAATEISQSNPYLQNSSHNQPSISASPIKNFSIHQSTNNIDSPNSKCQQQEIKYVYRSDPEISVKTSLQNESNQVLSNIQQSLIIERELQII